MKSAQYHWGEMKFGPGAPPIKTEQGWLCIYHVFQTIDGSVYVWVWLVIICRSRKDHWRQRFVDSVPGIPRKITGYVHNFVFTWGAVPESDGNREDLLEWRIVLCAWEANVSNLVDFCLEHCRPAKN